MNGMSYSRSSEIDENHESSDLNREYESVLVPTIYQLITKGHYEEALDAINSFYIEKECQDKNRQLKEKCDSWIAQVYEEQSRYDQALTIYDYLSQSVESNHLLFMTRQVDVARVLYKMQRHEEACSKIEFTLDKQDDGEPLNMLQLLVQYIDILEASEKKFPLKYRALIERLANRLFIRIDEFDLNQSNSICELIRLIHQENRNANRRYTRLVIKLEQVDDDHAVSMLEEYISNEKFEFYRNLAIEDLRDIYDDQWGASGD
jgi:tetratricopeptide (TPR) repeat protein